MYWGIGVDREDGAFLLGDWHDGMYGTDYSTQGEFGCEMYGCKCQ